MAGRLLRSLVDGSPLDDCPERSRARVLCAAKRTLDGEDSRRTMEDERAGWRDQEKLFVPYCS
jgi:hypothetical protein